MTVKIILAMLAHSAVLAVEVPHIIRHRLRREWAVVLGLTLLNAACTFIIALRLPVPGPGQWLEAFVRLITGG